jgi:hypothetical protein
MLRTAEVRCLLLARSEIPRLPITHVALPQIQVSKRHRVDFGTHCDRKLRAPCSVERQLHLILRFHRCCPLVKRELSEDSVTENFGGLTDLRALAKNETSLYIVLPSFMRRQLP